MEEDVKPEPPPPPSFARRYASLLLWFLQDQWFLLGIALVIVIASQVQVPASQQAKKELVVTYLSPSLVFFITGCTLPTSILIANYTKWKTHLFVQLQSFLMTSAISFGLISACASNPSFMDPALLVGMLIGACLPTTISSNVVMTKQAHGNQALTVVETTIGNGLSPFLSPVIVQMYLSPHAWYADFLPDSSNDYAEIYRRVFKQLGLSIYVPMAVGQLLQHFFPSATRKVFSDWKLSKTGSLALLLILWSTFDAAFSSGAFTSVKPSNNIFVVFINVAFIALWTGASFLASVAIKLPRKDTIAVCYCVPAKSIAIGVPLSAVLWVGLGRREQSLLQVPMVIFQCLQLAAASLLTIPFRRWVKREEDEEQEAKRREGPSMADVEEEREADEIKGIDQGAEGKTLDESGTAPDAVRLEPP